MTSPQLARVSLCFGLWTPIVALVLAWTAALSGAVALDALQGAGVDVIDRPTIAAAFSPATSYLAGMLLLGLAAGLRGARGRGWIRPTAAKLFAQAWIALGLGLTAAALLALHAEHAQGPEPVDAVHLWLLVPAWAWWWATAVALAATGIYAAHVAVVCWASVSRVVATSSVAIGALVFAGSSIAVAPSPARAIARDWIPAIGSLVDNAGSAMLALAGGSEAAAGPVPPANHYSTAECLDELKGRAVSNVTRNLARVHWVVDPEDVVRDAMLEICDPPSTSKLPLRGRALEPLLQTAAMRRAMDASLKRGTAARSVPALTAVLGGAHDDLARWEAAQTLECIFARLTPDERALFAESFDDDRGAAVRSLMARERLSKAAADKRVGMFRKRVRQYATACNERL